MEAAGARAAVRALTTRRELAWAYPVLRQLRTDLSLADFLSLYKRARERDGYTLVALGQGKDCLAVMGYRVLYDFVHRKHLYIDDLVTAEPFRSKGLGPRLLAYAEAKAKSLGCAGLRLCTGVENAAGKRFYERNGWSLRAVAFKKKLA